MKKYSNKQSGVVLMSALIILLTLTVLALALVRLSVVELKVAGASQRYQILFNDAETLIAHYFFNNQRNFVQGCLSNALGGTSGNFSSTPSVDVCRYLPGLDNSGGVFLSSPARLSVSNPNEMHTLTIPNIRLQYSRVEMQIEQTACVNRYFSQTDSGEGSADTALAGVFFNIRSRAWDILDTDSSVTVNTGLVAQLPPGDSCDPN